MNSSSRIPRHILVMLVLGLLCLQYEFALIFPNRHHEARIGVTTNTKDNVFLQQISIIASSHFSFPDLWKHPFLSNYYYSSWCWIHMLQVPHAVCLLLSTQMLSPSCLPCSSTQLSLIVIEQRETGFILSCLYPYCLFSYLFLFF